MKLRGAVSAGITSALLAQALAALACAPAPNPAAQAPPVEAAAPPAARVEEVIYGRAGGLPLVADLHRAATGEATSPAVLVVHGGGWSGGTRRRMDRVARHLADAGYVVLNVDYRLAPEHVYPAALDDTRTAVRWMRRHAERYRIDPTRIGAFGFSAGGHLVALLATQPDGDRTGDRADRAYRDGEGGRGADSASIQAAVLGGAPTDLRLLPPNVMVSRFLGGSVDEIPEVYAEASPITHVRPDLPPFFIYQGRRDWIVDAAQGRRFAAALEQSAVPHEYVEMPLGHVATYLVDADTLAAALAFLDRWLRP